MDNYRIYVSDAIGSIHISNTKPHPYSNVTMSKYRGLVYKGLNTISGSSAGYQLLLF